MGMFVIFVGCGVVSVLDGFGGWGCDGEGREEVGEEENSGTYVEGLMGVRTEMKMLCPGSSGIRRLFAKGYFTFLTMSLTRSRTL